MHIHKETIIGFCLHEDRDHYIVNFTEVDSLKSFLPHCLAKISYGAINSAPNFDLEVFF